MSGIRIRNGGALTTIQDRGRYGAMAMGFGPSGVMDYKAFRKANALLGNKENEAVLEATLLGPEIEFLEDNCFVLTGADMGATLNGEPVPRYQAVSAAKGSILKLGFAVCGVRAYIAFAGGLEVPKVMGSASTSRKYGLGGLEGRALIPGDQLPFQCPKKKLRHMERRKITPPDFSGKEWEIRVILGLQKEYFTEEGIETFFSTPYTVRSESDRMGYRLDGEPVACKETVDIISDGTVGGAIQIPADGKPIILMADRQTTGGYAKLGAVITADLSLLAQAAPGKRIHFRQVSVEEAQQLLIEENNRYKRLERRINRWL